MVELASGKTFHEINTKGLPYNDNIVWTNGDDKIPIIDGRIQFYDRTTGAYFDLSVKQVKGRGVADADQLERLQDKHRKVIELLQGMNWERYTAEQILKIVENNYNSNGLAFKMNPYKRTISELFRRKILYQAQEDIVKPPRYRLNEKKAKICMKTGLFASEPCQWCDNELGYNSSNESFCKGCHFLERSCKCQKNGD